MPHRFSRFPSIPAILLGLALIASAGSLSDASAVMTLIGDHDAATFCQDPVSVATLRWLYDSTTVTAGRRVSTRPAVGVQKERLTLATGTTRAAFAEAEAVPSRMAHLYRLTDLPPPGC